MSSMNPLELELEIEKITRAMMIRNPEIGQDLIGYLKSKLSVEEVAGMMIVSIERVVWFDVDSVLWTIENVIPGDVMREIHKMMSVSVYKRLITKGFLPGKDFSVDASGKLLLNDKAKTFLLPVTALS